jgi:hypothetical protein
MWAGTRRLLRLTSPPPGRRVLDRLGRSGPLSLSTAPHDSVAAVIEDATVAAADALIASGGGPAWDEAGFARLRGHFAGNLADTLGDVLAHVVAILDARRDVQRALEQLRAGSVRRRRAPTSHASSAGSSTRGSSRRPEPGGCQTSSAISVRASAGSSSCRTRWPSTATACARSTSSRPSTPARARRRAAR